MYSSYDQVQVDLKYREEEIQRQVEHQRLKKARNQNQKRTADVLADLMIDTGTKIKGRYGTLPETGASLRPAA